MNIQGDKKDEYENSKYGIMRIRDGQNWDSCGKQGLDNRSGIMEGPQKLARASRYGTIQHLQAIFEKLQGQTNKVMTILATPQIVSHRQREYYTCCRDQ